MNYKVQIVKKKLHFKQPAGTSRGIYTTRDVWFVIINDKQNGKYGIGECAPLPSLSCDDVEGYEHKLIEVCHELELKGTFDSEQLINFPSILFGVETATRHIERGSIKLWDTPFSRGKCGIPINGLIWMGNFDEMYSRIEQKLNDGFKCIKLKIGAIDFNKEVELLYHIRKHFSPEQIELRVDANGAFSPEDAMKKLKILSEFNIHSIEQPIRAGQFNEMSSLCKISPIPIALDEELIGINKTQQKIQLLDIVKPQYIILKPSLHGGIKGSTEWINLAKKRNIEYWVTSALESNIGLNAIAQWCSTLKNYMPQGLGTGMLFTDNINFPLYINNDSLWFDTNADEPDILKWINQ